MFKLTKSTTSQRFKVFRLIFADADYGKNMIIEKILSIFKSNSPPEDDVTQKWKVRTVEFIFSMISENVIVSEIAPWKVPPALTFFERVEKKHF